MAISFVAAIAVLVLLFVMMGVKIVHQGYRYTLEHFGRFVRVAEPGINFVMPFGGPNPLPQVLTVPVSDNSNIRFSVGATTGIVAAGAGSCCITGGEH